VTQASPGRARLPASLSSLVGRERETAELIRLLQDYRLVTVTGPGGVGKTRLAVAVAGEVADQFPDAVYFVELSAITDKARVPAEVAAALGVRQVPGRSPQEALAAALSAQRLLLVLDNCEHVLTAVAELCGNLLKSADDLRILATSREQLWVGGETRYRLSPLELPRSGDPTEIGRSAAVALFAERVRQAAPGFTLAPESASLAARVVAHLDGMPLAIELAAARVEALGLAGLADRIDDALRLLAGAHVLSADRHKSLTAVADWSYRLLSPQEQQVFRRLAAFPGPFTLEAAEAVAGPEAGPIVLRLVDCSLVAPPQPGPDQRMRYTLLQTLRTYGLARLEDAMEERETAAALAGFALSVAERAAAGLETRNGELQALRWLDAEDATLGQAVNWTLERDSESALRLASTLAPWWWRGGRTVEGYERLAAAAEQSSPDSRSWARAQLWLGHLSQIANPAGRLAHYTATYESGDGRESADALAGRAARNLNHGQFAEAAEDASRALALARGTGYPGGEAQALTVLSYAAQKMDAQANALDLARQAEETLGADIPDWLDRWCRTALVLVLTNAGELDSARRVCGNGLAWSRDVGDLANLPYRLTALARLERLSGNQEAASAYLHEAVNITARLGDPVSLPDCLEECALLCAEKEQWAAAVTLCAAHAVHVARTGLAPTSVADYEERTRRVIQALPADQAREAVERGRRMTLATAAEFVALLTAPGESEAPRATAELTERERELVTLVAQGRTNAEIAAQLFISIRTVSSHLDRIRDKTGYRRRADLTRLALNQGLV
jgi:predicted ATPase/DNA-binding CsgD family transcriptional regulator